MSYNYVSPNSTWLVTSRHDTRRSTCRAHAFSLSSLSNSTARHARLDAVDTSNVSCRDRDKKWNLGYRAYTDKAITAKFSQGLTLGLYQSIDQVGINLLNAQQIILNEFIT